MGTKQTVVALLFGGKSNEHEVSVLSAQEILHNLDASRYQVRPVFITREGKWRISPGPIKGDSTTALREWIDGPALNSCSANIMDVAQGIDVAFLGLHGKYGEDGSLQGTLEVLGLPYTGSGVLASALCFDKIRTKQIFAQNAIKTPAYVEITQEQWNQSRNECTAHLEKATGFPCVVKAPTSGSSCDMGIADDRDVTQNLIDSIVPKYGIAMVEEFIQGIELSCGVVEEKGQLRPLPPTQIIPKDSRFFDYKAKYEPGACEEITPALISKDLEGQLQKLAVQCHRILGCSGCSRTDFMCRGDEVFAIEINTLPGMTATSLIPQQAAAAGISYPKLLDLIIEAALR